MHTPSFLITIDTEGDDQWRADAPLTTRNAGYLERFQQLCERFGFKPCYLTNHEMAIDPVFQAFGRDILARQTGEIGMHLHAWNSPPLHPATDRNGRDKAYLIEYPDAVMRAKVDTMTKLLEDTFATRMISHRAGRWAFDARYAALLIEYGYLVDCSVTPHVDWSGMPGKEGGDGGTDYRGYPEGAYFMDPANPARPGRSPLLEIPMTTRPKYPAWLQTARDVLDSARGKRRPPSISWLRPKGGNAREMVALARKAASRGYAEFMLHSSEFMPGGSPTFRDEAAIEQLYKDLEWTFGQLAGEFRGATLAEFRLAFPEPR